MSSRLRQYLIDAYVGRLDLLTRRSRKDAAIQVDDQDDSDTLDDFCNIFVSVGRRGRFDVELAGVIPITPEISDLAEIYDGFTDRKAGKIVLRLNTEKIEALSDLATRIKATAFMGERVNNPNWDRISARTISSLRRFVRVVREFRKKDQAP